MTEEPQCPPVDSKIYNNYLSIRRYIKKRYEQLQKQLLKYGITNVSNQSFTELINQISDIQAIENYYDWNIKPLDDPGTIDDTTIDGYTFSEYNIFLAKQINYYMRLLGYYLIVKGVDIGSVNIARNLETRIKLLDFITAYQASSLSADSTKVFRYLITDEIPYALLDINGNPITSGYIYLKQDGKIIKYIKAGEPLYFTPKSIGETTYQIEYEGYAQYKPITIDYTINILKALPEININAFTVCDNTEKYTILLEKDTQDEQVNMDITFTATVIGNDGYAIPNKAITFYINDVPIQEDVTDSQGQSTVTYRMLTEEDIIVRAVTNEQVSNYLYIELTSYFTKLKIMLQNIRYVFTSIYEDMYGTLKSVHRYVSDINTVSDLDGIIYNMYGTDEAWGYTIFHPSHEDYITKEEFKELMNIVVDYHDDGHQITTRILDDINYEVTHENIQYFEPLKEMLHETDHVYTYIEEDANGVLIGTDKPTSSIQTVVDLEGVVYDMFVENDEWGYTVFNTNRTYITNNDFNTLMSIVVDYQDNGEEIIITTLGDINE